MGYPEELAKKAYEMCGKNEQKAANYLIDNHDLSKMAIYDNK
jgi:hypothetical protein